MHVIVSSWNLPCQREHQGQHVFCDRLGVPAWGVNDEDAVLGGEVEIETLAGKRIAVKVPAMTQNGKRIKLTGLGMPKLAKGKKKKTDKAEAGNAQTGNGDLYARVRITIPEELSDEQRELFEQLREVNKTQPAEAKA